VGKVAERGGGASRPGKSRAGSQGATLVGSWGNAPGPIMAPVGALQKMACHLRQASSPGKNVNQWPALYAIRFRGYVKQFTMQGRSRLEAQLDVVSLSVIDHLRRRCLQDSL